MEQPLVFITHSSKDKDKANELCRELRRRGLRIWIDQEQIGYGDSVPGKIANGLESCDVLLVLISHNLLESSWCRVEYESLLAREIETGRTSVIPVRLDNSGIPTLLNAKRYLNYQLHYPKKSEDLDGLVAQINAARNKTILYRTPKAPSYHSTRLGMIIGSVVQDFPVANLTDEQIAHGSTLLDLYRTIDHIICSFQDIADEILSSYTYAGSNRKLVDIAMDMRTIAISLHGILATNSALRERLKDILNICVQVVCGEGIFCVKLGFPSDFSDLMTDDPWGLIFSGKYPLTIDDHPENKNLDLGYLEFDEEFIREYNTLLASLSSYRRQLQHAIATATSESR